MKVEFLESFDRDLRKACNSVLAKQLRKLVLRLENTSSLADIPNVKKLAGGENF